MWRLKELICGPKVGSTEPACINNPVSGELITDKDTIKRVSLEHCARILTKNEIRDCDKGELETKEKMHEEVMKFDDKSESEEEGQNMFKLQNKAGKKYKDAIYW